MAAAVRTTTISSPRPAVTPTTQRSGIVETLNDCSDVENAAVSAPLTRMVFGEGDEVQTHNGEQFLIEEVIDRDGALVYRGEGHELPESARYYKIANRDYLQWAQHMGFIGSAEPIVLQLYSETLQKFRLSAERLREPAAPETHRRRILEAFDPLPSWHRPGDGEAEGDFPYHAVTQRPPAMYHSWGSMNAWLFFGSAKRR